MDECYFYISNRCSQLRIPVSLIIESVNMNAQYGVQCSSQAMTSAFVSCCHSNIDSVPKAAIRAARKQSLNIVEADIG